MCEFDVNPATRALSLAAGAILLAVSYILVRRWATGPTWGCGRRGRSGSCSGHPRRPGLHRRTSRPRPPASPDPARLPRQLDPRPLDTPRRTLAPSPWQKRRGRCPRQPSLIRSLSQTDPGPFNPVIVGLPRGPPIPGGKPTGLALRPRGLWHGPRRAARRRWGYPSQPHPDECFRRGARSRHGGTVVF